MEQVSEEPATQVAERVDRWTTIRPMQGGWLVTCRLCGKTVKKGFVASLTNYAEAERSSREYAKDHIASETHRAALDAYFADEPPVRARDEDIVRQIFGEEPLGEKALRRRAAHVAARRAEIDRRREEQRLRDDDRPVCAICGQAVSMKDERSSDRRELPSGALVHAGCVA